MITHSRMGIYSITQGTYDELVERTEKGLAPILRDSPGFISYSLTDLTDGRVVSLTTWQTREQAEAAGVTSAEWVSQNLAESVALHENVVGEVTTLDSQREPQSVSELLGELANRGTEALRGLQRRPAKTAESTAPEMASADRG